MISLRDVVTGFGNRDPLAEVWRRNLRGGGGGSAVITGVPPLRYIGDGRPLTDYLISGNAVQDGTPTPDAPVDVMGCGVRTGNLWDEDYTGISGVLKYVPFFVGEGTFTLSTDTPDYLRNAPLFLLSGNVTSGASTPTNGVYNGVSRTTDSSNGYITIAFRWQSETSDPITHKTMLNLGSTALPYEPYGFKLPLTVNGTEYPIYLGQVETTRRVKKQNVTISYMLQLANGNKGAVTENFPSVAAASSLCKCNIAPYGGPSTIGSFYVNPRNAVFVCAPGTTLSEARALLSGAVIWYVLATPETAVVNEPLMKIGDYADTISFAQAGVTIPTVNGANVLDVPTEVKPSEITIKGGISSV